MEDHSQYKKGRKALESNDKVKYGLSKMQLCIWMCSGILKRNTFRVEIKSVRLYNFNSDRVIYENWRNKLLYCNCSSQWVFKCVLRQLVKIDSNFELACFDICKENLWSLSRTTGEESQLWVIRTQSGLWKGVPLNTKRILGLCKLRTCLDLMVPNHQWRLYLGSCWQQIFIGHRSYHCVSLCNWLSHSVTPVPNYSCFQIRKQQPTWCDVYFWH